MKALCLSGGGSHGAFQVGVLKKLMGEDGNDYDIMCGISVGAINSAYLAQTPKGNPRAAFAKLLDLWNQVDNDKIKKQWFPFREITSLWKSSVYNTEPLQQWIKSGLDAKAIASSGYLLRVVAVSWDTGESYVAKETETSLADWVIASSSFPVFFTPIEINGQTWTDGGLRSVTPLGEAIRAGATEVDVILTADPYTKDSFSSKGEHALPALAMRGIDIMSEQIMRADLNIAGLKNDLATLRPKYRHVKIRVIEPSTPVTPNSLDFTPAGIQEMIAAGYKDGSAAAAVPTP